MKKIFLTSFLGCALIVNVYSQIKITSADMPSVNDTIRYSVGTVDQNILNSYKNTGTNYTWNFSSLTPSSQAIDQYASVPLIYYSFYGKNNIGEKLPDVSFGTYSLTNLYYFYGKSSSAYSQIGTGFSFNSIPLTAAYDRPDSIYKLPLSYGNRDSSFFDMHTNFLSMVTYSTTGYRINEVDGYGSITTPYGTYNCLRVKTTIYSLDTLFVGTVNQSMEYKWLTNNEKIPLLLISGTGIGDSFVPTTVQYRDKYRMAIIVNAPVPDFTADNTKPTTKDTVTFTNKTTSQGTHVFGYIWSFSPNTVKYVKNTDSSSQDPVVIFTQPGSYDVTLSAINYVNLTTHDSTKAKYINVSLPISGIESHPGINPVLNIYPNPISSNQLNFSITLSGINYLTADLFDSKGSKVCFLFSRSFNSGHSTLALDIPINKIPDGLYFVKLTGTNFSNYYKLVIQR